MTAQYNFDTDKMIAANDEGVPVKTSGFLEGPSLLPGYKPAFTCGDMEISAVELRDDVFYLPVNHCHYGYVGELMCNRGVTTDVVNCQLSALQWDLENLFGDQYRARIN